MQLDALDAYRRVECSINSVKTCPSCGGEDIGYKVIYWPPNNLQVRVICNECGHNHAVPHIENLTSRTNSTLANWRKQVLSRDNYKCVICDRSEDLEAHHIIPVCNDPEMKWKYNVRNGLTVCREHHKLIHKRGITPP